MILPWLAIYLLRQRWIWSVSLVKHNNELKCVSIHGIVSSVIIASSLHLRNLSDTLPPIITTFSILCMLRAYIVSKNYWIAIYINVHYWKVKYLFNVKSSNQSIFIDENSHVSTNSFFAMKIPGTSLLKRSIFQSSSMKVQCCNWLALSYSTADLAPVFADLLEYH
jgi:hypothetical protein